MFEPTREFQHFFPQWKTWGLAGPSISQTHAESCSSASGLAVLAQAQPRIMLHLWLCMYIYIYL